MVTERVACLSLPVPKGRAGARCCEPASYTLPAETVAPTLSIPVPSAENLLSLTLSPILTVGGKYYSDHPNFPEGEIEEQRGEALPWQGILPASGRSAG